MRSRGRLRDPSEECLPTKPDGQGRRAIAALDRQAGQATERDAQAARAHVTTMQTVSVSWSDFV